MHPSLRVFSPATRVHRPLIHFVGKRQWTSAPEAPHAHPFAPAEIKQTFSDFVKKLQSPGSRNATKGKSGPTEGAQAYAEFWEAPARTWDRHIEDVEIEAIQSGGASLY